MGITGWVAATAALLAIAGYFGLVVVPYVQRHPRTRPAAAEPRIKGQLPKDRAIMIARAHLNKYGGWADSAGMRVERKDTGWSVLFWKEGSEFPEYRMIQVSDDGKIDSLRGGF